MPKDNPLRLLGLSLWFRALTPLQLVRSFSELWIEMLCDDSGTIVTLDPELLGETDMAHLRAHAHDASMWLNPILHGAARYEQSLQAFKSQAREYRGLTGLVALYTPTELWSAPILELSQLQLDAYAACKQANPPKQ